MNDKQLHEYSIENEKRIKINLIAVCSLCLEQLYENAYTLARTALQNTPAGTGSECLRESLNTLLHAIGVCATNVMKYSTTTHANYDNLFKE